MTAVHASNAASDFGRRDAHAARSSAVGAEYGAWREHGRNQADRDERNDKQTTHRAYYAIAASGPCPARSSSCSSPGSGANSDPASAGPGTVPAGFKCRMNQ